MVCRGVEIAADAAPAAESGLGVSVTGDGLVALGAGEIWLQVSHEEPFLGATRMAVLRRVSRSFGPRLRLRALHLDTLLRTADSAPAEEGPGVVVSWWSQDSPTPSSPEKPVDPKLTNKRSQDSRT
jgi:hypothetical protein